MTVETYDPDRHSPVIAVDLNSVRDGLVGSLVVPDALQMVLGADDRVWAIDEDDDVWSAIVTRTRQTDRSDGSVWVEIKLEDW